MVKLRFRRQRFVRRYHAQWGAFACLVEVTQSTIIEYRITVGNCPAASYLRWANSVRTAKVACRELIQAIVDGRVPLD